MQDISPGVEPPRPREKGGATKDVTFSPPSSPVCCSSLPVQATIITLQADLNGANEVPPVDPDGTGFATFTIDTVASTITWVATAENIDLPVIAAHIHTGAAGVIGAPLIDFSAMLIGGP